MVNKELNRSRKARELESAKGPKGQEGFTIVEVIVAVVILAVGLLGMAGTTILVVQQTTLAGVSTDRSAALQSTIERLRATPFDRVVAGTDSVGAYDVEWTVTPGRRWKAVEIVTTGPGSKPSEQGFPRLAQSVPDTFTYRIIEK